MKYFAGGDTLLSRSIPLHHEIYQGKKKKKSKTLLELYGQHKFNIHVVMRKLASSLA